MSYSHTLQAVAVHCDHTAKLPFTWPGVADGLFGGPAGLSARTISCRENRSKRMIFRRGVEAFNRPNRIHAPEALGRYSHAGVFTATGGFFRPVLRVKNFRSDWRPLTC